MVEKKKEIKYDVKIRYRNNDVDKFYSVKSAGANGNVFEIEENSDRTIGIVLDIMSYYNIDRVQE